VQRYLLDTNLLSHLVRRPADLRDRLQAKQSSQLLTSIIVACELRFGARRKYSRKLMDRVDALLQALTVVPLGPGVAEIYADIRHKLGQSGELLGANDCLIAAHALEQDCILVTSNLREFRTVPNLKLENWVPRSS
jgi:tRNA(fMet)-specific endonuclease VapC